MLEYEGKELLRRQGIAVPAEKTAATVEQAARIAEELGYPVVVKAQVLAGGRGKAGGVRLVASEAALKEAASAILGMSIRGERCGIVLVAKAVDIAGEMYVGVTIDSMEGSPVLLFSMEGGVEIEELAKESPKKVHTLHLSCLMPTARHEILEFLLRAGLSGTLLNRVCTVVLQLVEAFFRNDCTTLEINPLIVSTDGNVIALDAKAVLDDSALKRQKRAQTDCVPVTDAERRAAAIGVNFVTLDGDVAVIAGGAGLAMATMDMVEYCGGRTASFLDTGGGISSENMAEALRLSCANPEVRGVVINIFGGMNDCAEVAKGISQALDNDMPAVSLVVKLRGHSQDEAWALLENRKLPVIKYGTTEDAVRTLFRQFGEVK
ncbi:MAG: acetate--CoA ligase family protein [Desulfovibrio sp.]|jgi:succinyl-CoA synthetase beta subunit|nr:acetate--CoA ligase family protein [Desulfovibrio sp.]